MKPAIAKSRDLSRGVELEDIRIGKDVIEILTSGMYVSPITVFREYVQNAADSIDALYSDKLHSRNRRSVEVTFDQAARSVLIRDEGAGLRVRDAIPTLIAVGASTKRGSQARGFRGVGRLSGLAYCRELQFRTKATGDSKIISMVWDCRGLRERLASGVFDGDLRRILAEVVTVSYEPTDHVEEHFFEVRLKDIVRLRNDLLLNESLVSHYLSQVAPIAFSPDFSFGPQIEKHLSATKYGRPIELVVAGEQIFRPYLNEMIFPATAHKLQVTDIEFLNLSNVDGTIGATGWIAHHEYVRSIPPSLGVRGLRARVGNLQVGDANLFDEIFKESRFNGWTIGEIHICDPRIIPNARRDNFEVNHHYYNLLVQLGQIGTNISQRCRSASVSRNAEQSIQNAVAEIKAKLTHKKSIHRAELSRLKAMAFRASTKVKRIDNIEKRDRLSASLERLTKRLAKLNPRRGASTIPFDEATSLVTKLIKNRAQAAQLIQMLRRLSS